MPRHRSADSKESHHVPCVRASQIDKSKSFQETSRTDEDVYDERKIDLSGLRYGVFDRDGTGIHSSTVLLGVHGLKDHRIAHEMFGIVIVMIPIVIATPCSR